MRRAELNIRHARGFLLIVAIIVLVVIAVAIAALGNMTSADVRSSSGHAQSEQAYFAAISGVEAATREFANGTACASLTFPGGAIASTQVGTGTFATSGTLKPTAFTATLQANIANNNTVPQIPLSFTVGSIANLAPHGEILIDNEFITYSGTSSVAAACSPVAAPCLTGVTRATNGTTIASHNTPAAITQVSQCVIRSTGTVQSANRVVESTVALNSDGVSNLYNGASTSIPTAGTAVSLTGGAWAPGLPAGDNYVIAIVTFQDITAGLSTINTPNLLQIVATNPAANPLVTTTSLVRLGNGAGAPSGTVFQQETQVLLARHIGATAAATYNLTVNPATSSGLSGRAQILVINGIATTNASFLAGGNVLLGLAATAVVTSSNLSLAGSALPAGDNIVIAEVQLDNTVAAIRNILAGNLAIRRGAGVAGTVLMSNTYPINLASSANPNRGTGYLLLALDPGAAAGTQYTVAGQASTAASINASSTILVFNGFQAALQPPITSQPPASVTFGAAATPLGSVTDTFRAGERVVLTGIQYQNGSGALRNVAAGNETITLNAGAVSSPPSANAYNWALCTTATATTCDDFFSGLLWRESPTAQLVAKPAFGVNSKADGITMSGAANILTIDLSVREINRMEIYP